MKNVGGRGRFVNLTFERTGLPDIPVRSLFDIRTVYSPLASNGSSHNGRTNWDEHTFAVNSVRTAHSMDDTEVIEVIVESKA